ncbi:MAG: ABC transporter substrate-binding protein [Actinomycetota bacterium]
MSRTLRLRALIGVLLALSLLAAACGDSDDSGSDDAAADDSTAPVETTEASADTEAPAETDAPADTEATEETEAPTTLEPVVIRQACAPTATALPGEVAVRNGLADEFAISFECVQVGAGPEVATALVTDAIDLSGFTASNAYVLLEQDVDLVFFRQVTSADFFDIVVKADFPLPNADAGWEGVMQDLATARIGVVARGAAAEDLARGLYSEAGLDPDQATYVATGLPQTTLAALQNNEVDAAITFDPGISLAVAQGIAIQPFSVQEGTGPDRFNWPGLFTGTLRENVEDDPDLFERYVDFTNAATAYAADPANRDEVLAVAEEFLGLPPEVTPLIVDRFLSQVTVDGVIDRGGLDGIGVFFDEIGKTESTWTSDDFVVAVG